MAIYARVSTDNQVGGRFDSCESQTAVCRDYVRQRADEGWYEVASFTDAAYSGGSMNRPGIQSIKRMIEAGEVKVVLIFKSERMLRNTDEWAHEGLDAGPVHRTAGVGRVGVAGKFRPALVGAFSDGVAADGRLTLAGVKTSADLVQSGNARGDRDGDNTGRGVLG